MRTPLSIGAALFLCASFTAGCRLLNYAAYRSAPISLRGRLRYGPLFLPRYDQVYFAPLCTAALALAAPLAMWKLGVDDMATLCATIALTLAAAINLPPTKYAWTLTGGHQSPRSAGKEGTAVDATLTRV